MQYLARNRQLFTPGLTHETADYPDCRRVFLISPMYPRFNEPGDTNQVTSACSPFPYRDDLFGPGFEHSVFICDPAHNLVHREVLEPDGVTFRSHRAANERTNEFLSSPDAWFRPVMAKTGPDGAVYVLDMHRLVIEHPDYIPRSMQAQYDLRAGHDMGRLYRIYPNNAKLRPIPRLDKMTTKELVAALDSPNGWQRDTAQRLLVQAQDKSAVRPLERLVRKCPRAKTRMQALCTLDGLNALTVDMVLAGLRDQHPGVREQAVRLSESFLRAFELQKPGKANELAETLMKLTDDPEIRVRYQLAFSLGEWDDPGAARALAAVAVRDFQQTVKAGNSPEAVRHGVKLDVSPMEIAVLSSATARWDEILEAVLSRSEVPSSALVEGLMGVASPYNNRTGWESVLAKLAQPGGNGFAGWQMAGLAGFIQGLERHHGSLAGYYHRSSPSSRSVLEKLDGIVAQARRGAVDQSMNDQERILCVRLLGRGLDHQDEDIKELGQFLSPQTPAFLESEAIGRLAQMQSTNIASVLLIGWKGYLPDARTQVLEALLSRPGWTIQLVDLLEKGILPPGQMPQTVQQRLLASPQPDVKRRAARVFMAPNPDRHRIVEQYSGVNQLRGSAQRGAELFQKNCTICHSFKGEGHAVGPNLETVSDKPVDYLLTAILDPSQSIEPRYTCYNVTTKDDREFTGIITSESATTIQLAMAGGHPETLARADLTSLTSSKISLMPEGFEKVLDPQSMADLIAYIHSNSDPATTPGK